jgi:hypothetical protein
MRGFLNAKKRAKTKLSTSPSITLVFSSFGSYTWQSFLIFFGARSPSKNKRQKDEKDKTGTVHVNALLAFLVAPCPEILTIFGTHGIHTRSFLEWQMIVHVCV